MNQRLQQFLDLENISPAKLSEILNVQRSNISHILNGRNKPSYDFICRMLSKFPSLNADWLLTGKGKPYKENYTPIYSTEENLSGSKNLHSTTAEDSLSHNNESKTGENSLFALNENNMVNPVNLGYTTDNKSNNTSTNDSELNENPINAQEFGGYKEKRKVKSVIIFYDDGSFDELKPEK